MFRILCIFAMWIGWFGHHLIRGKSTAPSIISMVDCNKRVDNMNTTRRKIYGIGTNNYPSPIQTNCKKMPSYNKWRSLLQRCYDKKFLLKNPSYADCYVCEEWLTFTNFNKWFNENYTNNYQLDKDLILKGNKCYCPEYCCFVPQEINELVIKCDARRGKYPLGVEKKGNKFRARIKKNNTHVTIGYFDTPEQAFTAYKEAKEKHIQEMATQYFNEDKITKKVYDALLNYEVEITD